MLKYEKLVTNCPKEDLAQSGLYHAIGQLLVNCRVKNLIDAHDMANRVALVFYLLAENSIVTICPRFCMVKPVAKHTACSNPTKARCA